MLEKNMLIQHGDSILRIIAVNDEEVYAINCISMIMPKWILISDLSDYDVISESDLKQKIELVPLEEELNAKELSKARKKYSLIAPILTVIEDDNSRNIIINQICKQNNISRRTLTDDLCKYLVYGHIGVFAGRRKTVKKELSKDQKNIRWALNKFYYTRHGNTLADSYIMMLKEKYTDEKGQLISEYPSLNQFRYFYRKTRKIQTEIISREGIKNYQLNYRPLLGDNIQAFAPVVGTGMIDSTICDLYLIDDSGKLIGRPILVACIDVYSGLCMGYALLWEGGVYSCRELMLNVITDKVEWCKKFGIIINEEDWDCHQLPGVIISDRGSEYISYNFEQITELGVQVISLPSFSANQKGPVEKLFSLIQDNFKPYLKGKGVVEPDIGLRGVKDYRKDACLTIEQFEKIIIHCILYHNKSRMLENYPLTEQMIKDKVAPYPSAIWNYGCKQAGANLIDVTSKKLILTLLPRTNGKFSRYGLRVNGMRYHCEGYTEQYLAGGSVTVAYNPDDVSEVYLVDDDYRIFNLIEKRYSGKTVDEAKEMKKLQKKYIQSYAEENLKARVALAQHIESIAAESDPNVNRNIKGIIGRKKTARNERHKDFMKEVQGE